MSSCFLSVACTTRVASGSWCLNSSELAAILSSFEHQGVNVLEVSVPTGWWQVQCAVPVRYHGIGWLTLIGPPLQGIVEYLAPLRDKHWSYATYRFHAGTRSK